MARVAQEEGRAGRAGAVWKWPALAAVLLVYVLFMGQRLAWSGQQDGCWFFLGPWWTTTTLRYLALAAGLAVAAFFAERRFQDRAWPVVLAVLLLGSQVLFVQAAWGTLGGQVPWGFDHPSFMFRLKEFGDVFPFALGGYNPLWNAGTEHFVGVTSGTHAYGVLNWPLLQLWDPHVFYGGALVFWFVLAFPWLGVVSLRAAGVNRAGAFCGGLLLGGVSRGLFLWMWHFGTMGAMTSAMMVLPVTALGYRLAVLRRGGPGTALALGIGTWLMCLWTPGVFVCVGLALGWLWTLRGASWRTTRWLLAAGGLALLLLLPWCWTTLFPCRNVLEHIGLNLARPAAGEMAANGFRRLVKELQEWHPLVLAAGGLGALALAPRPVRRWTLPVLAVLGLLAGWSREWKPLSQLDRMAIPMAVAAVFPAAVLCGRLFAAPVNGTPTARAARWGRAAARGIVLATLAMGIRSVRVHYANRGAAPIRLLPPEMERLVDWVRTEVPEEGRLGFAGRNVHFYGGGNIAYLPILAGREMMGDDYYGFPRGTVEFQYPPSCYRASMDRFLFFTRVYGITHWIATMPDALAVLDNQPGDFEMVRQFSMLGRNFRVFRVREPGPVSRFREGSGTISARINRLEAVPDDPNAGRVVIAYNWREGLVCRTPGATIEPVAMDENLQFIGIHPGGNERVVIGYCPHWTPIRPNFDGHFHH